MELLFFVPPGENLEDMEDDRQEQVGAAARGRGSFRTRSSAFFEALNDMTNYQRTYSIGEVEVEGSAIYHKTEYRERRNHYTLFACTRPIAGFDTDRDAFVGVHEGLHEARVPFAGQLHELARPSAGTPSVRTRSTCDLAPGAEESFAFVLAYVEQGNGPSSTSPS